MQLSRTEPSPPRWRNFILTIHIVASVGVLGADLALLALGAAGLRGAAAPTVYPAAHLLGSRVVAPLAVVALTTGILLGLVTRWGLLRRLPPMLREAGFADVKETARLLTALGPAVFLRAIRPA